MPTATYIAGRQLTFPSIRIPSFNSLSHTLNNAITLSATSRQFVLLCLLWYMSSALSNNSAKAILITFKYPVTLTFIQFAFISGWCLLLALFQQLRGDKSTALFGATHGIHPPTFQIILTTLPLSLFQIGGHIFGSLATSQIPVSVVHTVKVTLPSATLLLDFRLINCKGIVTVIHSIDISIHVQCDVFIINVFILITSHPRRHARMFL